MVACEERLNILDIGSKGSGTRRGLSPGLINSLSYAWESLVLGWWDRNDECPTQVDGAGSKVVE